MNTPHSPATAFWDQKRNKITTKAGKWLGGETVKIKNHDLFELLLADTSYMQLVVLNATGKLVSPEVAKWLEVNFAGLSYPDARIWCNQIAALAASCGASVPAATLAGTLSADSRAYGARTNVFTIEFLQSALKDKQQGKSTAQIVEAQPKRNGKPDIPGFARPVARVDERIKPYQEMMSRLNLTPGQHLSLAMEIDVYLAEQYGTGVNSGGFASAFMADQGFTPHEAYHIKSTSVSSGALACAVDNAEQQQTAFLPQRCDDIDYQGIGPRTL